MFFILVKTLHLTEAFKESKVITLNLAFLRVFAGCDAFLGFRGVLRG
jgi:hypothetical protein